MSSRALLALVGLGSSVAAVALLVACASEETSWSDPGMDASTLPEPSREAEAGEDAEPGPCDDCMYFPDTCEPGTLCPSGSFDTRLRIHTIRGRAADDIWAAGAHGLLLHFDGASWKPSVVGTNETLRSLWLRETSEISFATLGSIYSRGLSVPDAGPPSADGWVGQGPPPGPAAYKSSFQLEGVWALPGAEWLWCATMYKSAFIAPALGSGLWRLHVSPTTNALEVAEAIPLGTCKNYPCNSMTAVHGASANTLWTVGAKGATFRITDAQGAAPGIEIFNSRTWAILFGVWAAADDDVWSVGGLGTIRHYTGKALDWDIVPDVPTTEMLRAVWGSSSSDVWAVGDRGVALHWDGKAWSRIKVAGLGMRRPNLHTVWMPSPGHVWIGGDGVLLSLGGKP